MVDKEILTTATVHGLKFVKLVSLVMAETAPDLPKVMDILQCFCNYASPHTDEFQSLYKEAKIQVQYMSPALSLVHLQCTVINFTDQFVLPVHAVNVSRLIATMHKHMHNGDTKNIAFIYL